MLYLIFQFSPSSSQCLWYSAFSGETKKKNQSLLVEISIENFTSFHPPTASLISYSNLHNNPKQQQKHSVQATGIWTCSRALTMLWWRSPQSVTVSQSLELYLLSFSNKMSKITNFTFVCRWLRAWHLAFTALYGHHDMRRSYRFAYSGESPRWCHYSFHRRREWKWYKLFE